MSLLRQSSTEYAFHLPKQLPRIRLPALCLPEMTVILFAFVVSPALARLQLPGKFQLTLRIFVLAQVTIGLAQQMVRDGIVRIH